MEKTGNHLNVTKRRKPQPTEQLLGMQRNAKLRWEEKERRHYTEGLIWMTYEHKATCVFLLRFSVLLSTKYHQNG